PRVHQILQPSIRARTNRGAPPWPCARSERLRSTPAWNGSIQGVAAGCGLHRDAALPRRALRDRRHLSAVSRWNGRSAGRQPSSPRRDPQGSTWLRAVRPALRQAGGRPATSLRYAGYYQTELDRTLISASTTVVSVLIPRTRAVLPLRPRSDG